MFNPCLKSFETKLTGIKKSSELEKQGIYFIFIVQSLFNFLFNFWPVKFLINSACWSVDDQKKLRKILVRNLMSAPLAATFYFQENQNDFTDQEITQEIQEKEAAQQHPIPILKRSFSSPELHLLRKGISFSSDLENIVVFDKLDSPNHIASR